MVIADFSAVFCTMFRFFHRFRWHILFWILYFVVWTGFSMYAYHSSLWLCLAVTATWFIGQAGMIYPTVYVLVPRFLKPRRVWWFVLYLLLSIAGSAAFTSVTSDLILKEVVPSYTLPFPALFGYVCIGNTYWALISIGFVVFRDRLRNERRTKLLEKEHTENELRFLKSQMNPHFLFNAINSIYVLIKKDPDLAAHTLASFSDMLRYQLYDCAADYIPVEKEVAYLENYIRLEQLRKGAALNIDYSTDESVRQFSIAPMLLMPLVENAFKYVSSYTDRENEVRIRLTYAGGLFVLEVGNTMEHANAASGAAGGTSPAGKTSHTSNIVPSSGTSRLTGGIGLGNVRRRLALLYPERHSLEIIPGNEYYTAFLKLQIV